LIDDDDDDGDDDVENFPCDAIVDRQLGKYPIKTAHAAMPIHIASINMNFIDNYEEIFS